MNISSIIKNRFCTDNNYPIKIFKEPFFEKRLKTLGYYQEWLAFKDMLESNFNNEQEYLEHYNKVKNNAIDFIKEQASYKKFESYNIKDEYNPFKIDRSRNGIFKKSNIGKVMLSVDLSSANFSALKYFNPNIVANKNSYYDFISQFTEIEHIRNSKYIRQVIFGNVNPKRQTRIEKFLIGRFIPVVLKTLLTQEEYQNEVERRADNVENILISYMDDEIVFDLTRFTAEDFKRVDEEIKKFSKDSSINVRSDFFKIYNFEKIIDTFDGQQIVSETDFYLKKSIFGDYAENFEFKCIDPISYPLVYSMYMGNPVAEEDKYFYHEGFVAKIIDNIQFRLRGTEGITNEEDIIDNRCTAILPE